MASKRGFILKCFPQYKHMYVPLVPHVPNAHKSSQYGGIKWWLAFETLHLMFVLAKTNSVQGTEKQSALTVSEKQEH